MKNVIIVREYKKETDVIMKTDLFKKSVMSHMIGAFLMFLFKEITLQFIILLAAISFIFLGLPLLMCLMSVPIVAVIVFLVTYTTHLMKAGEMSQIQPIKCWVAEVHEPYLSTADPKYVNHQLYDESQFVDTFDTSCLTKNIIGTLSVRDYYGPDNSLWLYGLAVHSRYRRKGIAKLLIKKAIDFAKQNGYDSIELVTTDLQHDARLVFQEKGFQLKNIYHRQVFGLVTLGKYQMSYPLTERPNKTD